jgi:hypothetical protein
MSYFFLIIVYINVNTEEATYGTQNEEKQNTTYIGHHYAEANTYNVIKT